MNNVKLIVIGLVVFVVLFAVLLVTGVVPGWKPGKAETKNLTFWGFEDEGYYAPLIADFSKTNPTIQIAYKKIGREVYEKKLLEAFATQTGPDIFEIENTWVPRYLNKIAPAPSAIATARSVRQTLVDAAVHDFVRGDFVYGLPYYIDTLGLFYNDAILKSAGFSFPPKDWDEFIDVSSTITRKDIFGGIELAGAALGAAENVAYAADLLELLMMQAGLEIADQNTGAMTFDEPLSVGGANFNAGAKALDFYTSFANTAKENYSWSNGLPNSLTAFTSLKTAMVFEYSGAVAALEANYPKFNFKTAEIPQPKNVITKANIARYHTPVVWASSPNRNEAWAFLAFLVSPSVNDYYTKAFGRPTSLLSLVETQRVTRSEKLSPFIGQSLTAKSFYQFDNDAIERVFLDMIAAGVKQSGNYDAILQEGARKLDDMMKE